MATHRRIVTTTAVTPDMLRTFALEFEGGSWEEGTGAYFTRNERTIWAFDDTRLWPYFFDDKDVCRQVLKAEPKSDITLKVFNPRDDESFAWADEIRRAMIDRWGGLFFEDIFGVYE